MAKKWILITGGAGFIGYHLACHYKDDLRYNVLIVDNFSRGEKDSNFVELVRENDNITFLNIDLCYLDSSIINILETYTFEIVYHLAATNGTNNFYKNPSHVLENNIDSTKMLLKSLNNNRCKKFVFASTCETYYGTINKFEGFLPTIEEVPLCIDDIFNKRASYAISKIAGESFVINMCHAKNIPFVILRYHNIYGERMGKDGHVVPDIIGRIKRLENNKDLEVNGAYQTRSFMYINDAIKDTTKVAESCFSNEIFNIGIEKETEIIDIVKRLLEYSGKNLHIIDKGSPLGSVNRRLPDMNKFKEFFGKSKYTSLTEGLLKTYLWYEKKE